MHQSIIALLSLSAVVGVGLCANEAYKTCTSNCSLNFMGEYNTLTNGAQNPGAVPGLLLLLDAAASQADPEKSSTVFDSLCNLCEKYSLCLTVCEEPLRTLIEEGLAPIRFLCATKREDYKQALPCLVKSDSKIRDQCEANTKKLWPIATSVQNIRELPLTLRPSILELYCTLTSQYMDCTIPAVRASCGDKPAALMRQVQDISLNRIAIFLQNPPQSPVPNSCDALIQRARNFQAELNDFKRFNNSAAAETTTAASSANNNAPGAGPVIINQPATDDSSLEADLATGHLLTSASPFHGNGSFNASASNGFGRPCPTSSSFQLTAVAMMLIVAALW